MYVRYNTRVIQIIIEDDMESRNVKGTKEQHLHRDRPPPHAALKALQSQCPASEEAYADDDEPPPDGREDALVERGWAGADERGYADADERGYAALEGAEGERAQEGEVDAGEDAYDHALDVDV
ncbi:hypothetical protein C8R44DRAFT_986995 [Mycena epipterygia]|nr:hypothetical protein C8R44DRAFT_986995 [Mycena epipterygia]